MTGWQPCHRRTPHWLPLTMTVPLACALLPLAVTAQTGTDFDCVDFDSREDAQAYYEEIGGPLYDPYNLDDDEDGQACEEWKGDYERTAAGEDGINGQDGIDTDCADYANAARAQRYFLADGGSARLNVDHLDPNHNGIACEEGEPG